MSRNFTNTFFKKGIYRMKVKYLLTGVTVLFIVSLLTTSGYAKLDLGTCVGMWLLDEDKGDTAMDSSGNQNDGTLKNDPKWVEGKFGRALEFDGGNYVEVPASESFFMRKVIRLPSGSKQITLIVNRDQLDKMVMDNI